MPKRTSLGCRRRPASRIGCSRGPNTSMRRAPGHRRPIPGAMPSARTMPTATPVAANGMPGKPRRSARLPLTGSVSTTWWAMSRSGWRIATTTATAARRRTARLGSRALTVLAVSCAPGPGSSLLPSSARRNATGSPPTTGSTTLVSGSLGRLHLKSLVLCLLGLISLDVRLSRVGRLRTSREQQRPAERREHRQDHEAERITAGVAKHEAHHQRREKPTETARAADDTADQPGVLREILCDQLENRAVAESEADGNCEQQVGDDHEVGVTRLPGEQEPRHHDEREHPRQYLDAAEEISQPAADRPCKRRGHREDRRLQAGVFSIQRKPVSKQLRKVVRKEHEAAERHEVEQAEVPRDRFTTDRSKARAERLRLNRSRRIAREQPEQQGHDRHRDQVEPKRVLSAPEEFDERRHREYRRRGADISDAVDTQRRTLPVGAEPTADEWNADRKARAGDS